MYETTWTFDRIKGFIEAGNSVDSVLEYGLTPLMISALVGDGEAVNWLIKRGVNPELGNEGHGGNTALIYAAAAGYEEVTRILVNAGADVLAGDEVGVTALESAARSGRFGVVKYLLTLDVDYESKDDDEISIFESARHLAKREGRLDVLSLFDDDFRGKDREQQKINESIAMTEHADTLRF